MGRHLACVGQPRFIPQAQLGVAICFVVAVVVCFNSTKIAFGIRK